MRQLDPVEVIYRAGSTVEEWTVEIDASKGVEDLLEGILQAMGKEEPHEDHHVELAGAVGKPQIVITLKGFPGVGRATRKGGSATEHSDYTQ